MATRTEKEANGQYAVVLDGFEKGIAENPYSGMQDLRQVNIRTIPGIVSVGFPLTQATTSGATLGRPIAKSTSFFSTYGTPTSGDGIAHFYDMVDDNGRVWESTTIGGTWTYLSASNTTTAGDLNIGLCHWNSYLFKFQGAAVHYWNGSAWVNWSTSGVGTTTAITSGVRHFATIGPDKNMYFCNGNYVGSVTTTTPTAFDPTSGGTFTFNASALALPTYETAQSLAGIGSGGGAAGASLLVGGTQNAIYPFNLTSTTYSFPIYVADYFIGYMISANQNVFIFPGNPKGTNSRGRIYITNGSQANLYYKIPDQIIGYVEPYYTFGEPIFYKNNLMFGFLAEKNSNQSSIIGANEIWAIDLETLAFRSISTPTADLFARVLIPDQSGSGVQGYGYAAGIDGGSGGTNFINKSVTTTGIGTGIVKCDVMPVGTLFMPKTFSQFEFKLMTPLSSGESISLYAITDRNTRTLIGTNSTTGAISGVFTATIQANQWLQIEADLTGNSEQSGCQLKEIRLR